MTRKDGDRMHHQRNHSITPIGRLDTNYLSGSLHRSSISKTISDVKRLCGSQDKNTVNSRSK